MVKPISSPPEPAPSSTHLPLPVPVPVSGSGQAIPDQSRLAYIGDMLAELASLSQHEGETELAAVLRLAVGHINSRQGVRRNDRQDASPSRGRPGPRPT
jgi:hypothetical protein